MGDSRTPSDGGQLNRTERIEAIAAELTELGPMIREQAAGEAAQGDIQLPDAAPAPQEYDDHDSYLQAAHVWAIDEFLDAVSDLEHRTLELKQAVEVYPVLGDDRTESTAHREVVWEDLADAVGAVNRVVRAGARLSRLEAAYDVA